jgi:hypothetical protein
MTTKSDNNIAALATLFPAVFSAEPWQAHRPLKVGIGDDLVACGVLGAPEVNAALKRYADRLMYQKSLAAGGARIDLEGNVAGEVSIEQRCRRREADCSHQGASVGRDRGGQGRSREAKGLSGGPPYHLRWRSLRPLPCRRLHKRRGPPVAVASGSVTSSARRWSGGRVRRRWRRFVCDGDRGLIRSVELW